MQALFRRKEGLCVMCAYTPPLTPSFLQAKPFSSLWGGKGPGILMKANIKVGGEMRIFVKEDSQPLLPDNLWEETSELCGSN